jgi:hypothetical protein
MHPEITRLFKDMLFLHGHVADARLGAELAKDAASPTPGTSHEDSFMNLFKSFWLLGGLASIDPRVADDEAQPFGPTYGNQRASERIFGRSRDDAPTIAKKIPAQRGARITADDQRVAHC